jgi:hypothetical protein
MLSIWVIVVLLLHTPHAHTYVQFANFTISNFVPSCMLCMIYRCLRCVAVACALQAAPLLQSRFVQSGPLASQLQTSCRQAGTSSRNSQLQMLDYRQHEQDHCNALLNCSPVSISVLLGPPDCGKTAFVRQQQQQQQQQPDRPVCYISGRKTVLDTPADISRAIVQQTFTSIADSFSPMPDAALETVGYKALMALSTMMAAIQFSHVFSVSIINVKADADAAQLAAGFKRFSNLIRASHIAVTAADLVPILETFLKMLELWQQSGMQHVPALFIYEANVHHAMKIAFLTLSMKCTLYSLISKYLAVISLCTACLALLLSSISQCLV